MSNAIVAIVYSSLPTRNAIATRKVLLKQEQYTGC